MELQAALKQFLNAQTLKQAVKIVKQYPELLSEDVDRLLQQMIEAERKKSKHHDLEEHHEWLDRCRESGIGEEARILRLLQSIEEFVGAKTWGEAQGIVEAHPDLLSDEADTYLLRWQLNAYRGNEASWMLNERRELLRRCRQIGIAEAFAEKLHNISVLQKQAQLENILKELFQAETPQEISHRIQLCHQALNLVDREANPELWATLHSELGNSFSQNVLENRAENLEQAIAAYQLALQIRTYEDFPTQWAVIISTGQ